MFKSLYFSRVTAWLLMGCTIASLAGCAAAGAVAAVASATSSVLGAAGLKKDENAPTKVNLSIEAGQNLNESNGEATALVTKIYYLKNSDAFKQVPMNSLVDEKQEKARLGDSVLSEREITLTPGQVYRNVESVPKDATSIAVAGLFFAPAPYRWKYVFDVKDAKDTGIVIGAFACAMTVQTGKVSPAPGTPNFDPARLNSLQCSG